MSTAVREWNQRFRLIVIDIGLMVFLEKILLILFTVLPVDGFTRKKGDIGFLKEDH